MACGFYVGERILLINIQCHIGYFYHFLPVIDNDEGVALMDFVKWFPLGVSIVLGVSLLIAVFMVPWMQYTFKEGTERR